MEKFIETLPGLPDNIRYDGEGHYLIALATVNTILSTCNMLLLLLLFWAIGKYESISAPFVPFQTVLCNYAGIFDLLGSSIQISLYSKGFRNGGEVPRDATHGQKQQRGFYR